MSPEAQSPLVRPQEGLSSSVLVIHFHRQLTGPPQLVRKPKKKKKKKTTYRWAECWSQVPGRQERAGHSEKPG